MEHSNLSQGNLVSNKVIVDLDVLRARMVDGISGHTDNADTVTVHNSSEAMAHGAPREVDKANSIRR
jgi:hypothetical protein